MTVEPTHRRPRRGALALRRLATGGIGAGVGVFAGAAAVLFVGAAWPVGLAIGAVIGLGSALLMTPRAPGLIEIPGADAIAPTTVESTLDATLRSADEMDAAMRRLQSRPLWSGSDLDERIHRLIGGVRTLATTPAMQARGRIDGDVHMLHVLGTDYLPTIVNLAIENDRMHSSFSGRSARAEVEKNVRSLEQQAAVLGEALEQIEADVVRGTTKSVYEHAAFLQLRFDQLGTESVLDLDQPLRETPQHETPQRASGAPEPPAAAPAPRAAEQAPSGRPAPQARSTPDAARPAPQARTAPEPRTASEQRPAPAPRPAEQQRAADAAARAGDDAARADRAPGGRRAPGGAPSASEAPGRARLRPPEPTEPDAAGSPGGPLP